MAVYITPNGSLKSTGGSTAVLSTALKFPSDIKSSAQCLVFTCYGASTTQVVLPMPGSLQFADGASYNGKELGIRGAMAMNAASTLSGQGANMASARNIVTDQFNKGKSAVEGGSISNLIQGISSAFSGAMGDSITSGINIGTGTTLNTHITTEFTSVNTRIFSFSFQLIPQNSGESKAIANIVTRFRENLYPEATQFQLKYPPKWKISTKNANGLPKIGELYLTDVDTTYNSTTNFWREDGYPLETTLVVRFMETKAHTKDSISNPG